MKSKLKHTVLRWLGLAEIPARVLDIEKHFVTRRNEQGQVVETLADVPVREREERKSRLKGMTWQQRQKWYEATDGGRFNPPIGRKEIQ